MNIGCQKNEPINRLKKHRLTGSLSGGLSAAGGCWLKVTAAILVSMPTLLLADSTTVINEIFYHPAEESQTEWIELANTMSYDMDLGGWRLTGGIDYAFPADTIIKAGGYLVVAADPSKVRLQSLFDEALGPFAGRLSNGGETIELRNVSGRLMSWMEFGDREPWPVAADGSGASLAKHHPETDSDSVESWTASRIYGGTPGGQNFRNAGETSLQIHETAPAGDQDTFWFEVSNTGASTSLKNHVVAIAGNPQSEILLPDIPIAENGLTMISGSELGLGAAKGDLLSFYTPNKTSVIDAVLVDDVLRGRSPDHPGRWLYPSEPTPGNDNTFSFTNSVVINEIMYRPYSLPASPATPPVFEQREIVGPESNWDFWQGVPQQDDTWQLPGFDDSEWETGKAPFSGGNTVLPDGAGTPTNINVGKSVYYFRLAFDIAKLAEGETLQLHHLVDDGAVFYLNGEELTRFNLPDGTITSSTRATDTIEEPQWSNVISVPGDRLQIGTNVLSAELHSSSAFDRSLAFAARISLGELVEAGKLAEPLRDSPEEWIELYNRGDEVVDLSGWSFDEAVRFDFPEGTQLDPDNYLVITNDIEVMKDIYPQLSDVIGDFRGSLSNSGENILLRDAQGNPADEVRYYDGGRWPGYADGGGSSLELRDPRADNARAEAWAGSDESGKVPWQEIRYRMTSGQTYGLNTWNELNIGMLKAGEVMIDDVKVIHRPDDENKQLIKNSGFAGTLFDSDPTQHWRAVGNHRHTRAAPDPEDSDNTVFHVIASGATDTKHNHLETTFSGDTRLVDGDEYEVSLRARWVAGSNQLNVRAYFARLAHTILLDTPRQLGTPGLPNSRLAENLGPTYDQFQHAPLMPAENEDVTVSVAADDPDGVDEMVLVYAADGEAFARLPMEKTNGIYRATIPAMAAATVVQFYVEGRDSLGTVSHFPAKGPDSRALYIVDDGRSTNLPVHELRLIMKEADFDFLFERLNLISNERLGCSIVVDNREIIYDTGVRLKGSPAGRARDGALYQGFNLAFPPEQRYRGIHSTVSIDRSGRSPRAGDQDEVYIKHMFNRAGIPGMFDDLGYVVSPTTTHTGTALFSMARYGRVFTNTQFEDGENGSVFNLEITYDPTTASEGRDSVKNPVPFSHGGRTDFRDLGDDKEQYRWALEMRTGRRADDYEGLIRFCQTMSLPKDQLAKKIDEVMDVDSWMRTAAMHNLCGIGDTWWNAGLEHNLRLYVPRGGDGVVGLPWDLDFVFSAGATSPIKSAGGNLRRVMDIPVNTRLYYGHLLDIVDTVFNPEYMERWLSHYGSVVEQNYSPQLGYIRSRGNSVRSQIASAAPPVDFAITTNGGDTLETEAHVVTLEGQGWVNVRTIRVAGQVEPANIRWTSSTNWELELPLISGNNSFTLEAYDFTGELLDTQAITVINHSTEATPFEHLRISEVHYHPADPTAQERDVSTDADDFEFIELHNLSDQTLDLTGVAFTEGIEMSFPPGTTLAPGAYAVVVNNRAAFEARYGTQGTILGEYAPKSLSNGGERLVLQDGAHAILAFDYRDDWITETDGEGNSLIIINVTGERETWSQAASWESSSALHGSPGAPNIPPVNGALSYAAWTEIFFPAGDSTLSGQGADPDGDQIPNLLEFAFGLNPVIGDSLIWSGIITGDHFEIQYQRPRKLPDLEYEIQVSNDLQQWERMTFENMTTTPIDEDLEMVTIQITPEEKLRYVRISVSL